MQTFPKSEGVWTRDFGSDPSLIWSSIWQAKCCANTGTMKNEVSCDTACWKKRFLRGGSRVVQEGWRKGSWKLQLQGGTQLPPPSLGCWLQRRATREKRPPASLHAVLVLPADPLPALFRRPKPHPSPGRNCQEPGFLALGSMSVRRAKCRVLSWRSPLQHPRSLFTLDFQKHFGAQGCMEVPKWIFLRNRRNFKGTLSPVFLARGKVLRVSENLIKCICILTHVPKLGPLALNSQFSTKKKDDVLHWYLCT